MDVTNQVRAFRTQRGLSGAELAERVGVSRQTIHAIESGAYTPNTTVALRLARELVDAMEKDADDTIEELRADGGAAANDFLLQFQADILGKPVVRPKNLETTALGAAFLAGQAAGFWKGTAELEQFWEVERRFEPEMTDARREELYAGWKEAIKKSRTN